MERLVFNGSLRIVFVSSGVMQPGPITVHSDKVYWANTADGSQAIKRISVDGTGLSNFVPNLRAAVKGLAFLGSDLYWTERRSSGNRLMVRDGFEYRTVASGLDDVAGLVALDSSGEVGECMCGYVHGIMTLHLFLLFSSSSPSHPSSFSFLPSHSLPLPSLPLPFLLFPFPPSSLPPLSCPSSLPPSPPSLPY